MSPPKRRIAYALCGFLTSLLAVASAFYVHRGAGDDQTERSATSVDSSLSDSVVWVITEDATKSCRTPAAALRRIQQRQHGDVPITVLYSGMTQDDAQYIMTRERITANFMAVTANAHQRLLGRPLKASIHVINGAEISRSWDYLSQDHWWEVDLSSHISKLSQ